MDKRIGFIGIVIEDRSVSDKVNTILSNYGSIINGRIGIPNHQIGAAVIGLVVEGTNEQIGALTGKLGNLQGVTVKSSMTNKKKDDEK